MSGAKKWTLLVFLLFCVLSLAEECVPGKTKVQITAIEFEGTPGLTASLRNEIREQIEAKVHDYCQLSNEVPERARDILQQHGYFKALVQDPTWKQVGGNDDEQQIKVLLVAELGSIFTLDSMRFNGNTVFDQQRLRSAIPIQDGDLFNIVKIRDGLKNLHNLYCASGYINFTPVPNAEINDEKHVISLVFDLDQGEQFRVGQLTFHGIEPYAGAAKQMMDAWRPYVGEVYDCRIWNQFSAQAKLQKLPALASALKGIQPGVQTNVEHHTMDFVINFPDR